MLIMNMPPDNSCYIKYARCAVSYVRFFFSYQINVSMFVNVYELTESGPTDFAEGHDSYGVHLTVSQSVVSHN
jgi:hypothetical protein